MLPTELNLTSATYSGDSLNTESDKAEERAVPCKSVFKESEKSEFQPLEQRTIKTTAETFRQKLIRINKTIQSLDIPFERTTINKLYKQAVSDLEDSLKNTATGSTDYPDSVHDLIRDLLPDICFPANISVIQALADQGLGLKTPQYFYNCNVPAPLLKQLMDNTEPEAARKILLRNAKNLICRADPAYMELLTSYLSEEKIQGIADKLMEPAEDLSSLLRYSNRTYRFSDQAAPCLLRSLLSSLDPLLAPSISSVTSRSVTEALHSQRAISQLCLLEAHAKSHQQQLLPELQKLSPVQREHLLLCAFVSGQAQLFDLLTRTLTKSPEEILTQTFEEGANILHLLVSALADTRYGECAARFSGLDSYTPDYEYLFSLFPAEQLANQQDDTGTTPLAKLYRHHIRLVNEIPLFGSDVDLFQARRNPLLRLTSAKHLGDCMDNLLQGASSCGFRWFGEFMQLFKRLPEGQFNPASLKRNKPTSSFQSRTPPLQPVMNFLEASPTALKDKARTLELINLMQALKLSTEYQVQVIRSVSPDTQQYILESLAKMPGKQSLFIEPNPQLSVSGSCFYPWHLISLGTGLDYGTTPDNNYSQRLLGAVAEYEQSHQKTSVPELPAYWEKELTDCNRVEVYGRSIAFPSRAVPTGFRRFKFLKQQAISPEKWQDFIREQPHLTFFRQHQAELGLESSLLKPRGIFHLTDAREKLKACGLPESALSDIAFEADGSTYLQIFDDEEHTSLYHHYPYETDGVPGLSVAASFEGVRLFARDAGRLWRHHFQAPDSLSAFHNIAEQRIWMPTPYFGGGSNIGILREWNTQDYPNIAPAPVGMRDWADIRGFSEQTTSNFGQSDSHDAISPDVQKQIRVTELGKAFYGLALNWLRVRHDTGSLDYKNSGQMNQLANELVTIAADLSANAFDMEPARMEACIRLEFPEEALSCAVLECAYWCDPDCRYVQDIRNGHFPAEVYPGYSDQKQKKWLRDLNTRNLTDKGFWHSTKSRGPNLGINGGTFPLTHLDSLFWFAMFTGWKNALPAQKETISANRQ